MKRSIISTIRVCRRVKGGFGQVIELGIGFVGGFRGGLFLGS